MSFDAIAILQSAGLAVTGWTLLEVIKLKVKVAEMQIKIDMLPCDKDKSSNGKCK